MHLKTRPFALLVLAMVNATGCTSTNKKNDLKPSESEAPKMTKPEMKKVWIPDRIEANRFEEGHWLYVIDKPVSFKGE